MKWYLSFFLYSTFLFGFLHKLQFQIANLQLISIIVSYTTWGYFRLTYGQTTKNIAITRRKKMSKTWYRIIHVLRPLNTQCHALLTRIREVIDLLSLLPDIKRETHGVRRVITGAIHNDYCYNKHRDAVLSNYWLKPRLLVWWVPVYAVWYSKFEIFEKKTHCL